MYLVGLLGALSKNVPGCLLKNPKWRNMLIHIFKYVCMIQPGYSYELCSGWLQHHWQQRHHNAWCLRSEKDISQLYCQGGLDLTLCSFLIAWTFDFDCLNILPARRWQILRDGFDLRLEPIAFDRYWMTSNSKSANSLGSLPQFLSNF